MKVTIRRLLLTGILCFMVGAGTSVEIPQAATDKSPISPDSLKADVFFLAASEMAGRDTASREGLIATNFVAAEFMRLGLEPIADGTYFQKFPMVRAGLDRERTSLSARWGGAEKTFQLGHDFNWYVQSNAPASLTGSITFAGYGATAPEYQYDDYAGIDIRGKIVMILAGEPQMRNEAGRFKASWNTYHAYNRHKIENARKHGVGGLLIVQDWMQVRPAARPSGPRPSGDRPYTALASRILDLPTFLISRETANELLKASGRTIEQLRESIERTGKPASQDLGGVEVTMTKEFLHRQVVQTRNVVGLLEGSDSRLKEEVVAVIAHHDHLGVSEGRIYYGADDNASGVAGVLEIARAFARGAARPRRSVLFVVFEAEEGGLLGAYHYAMNPVVPLEKTAAILNMDMIGRDEDSPTWNTHAADNRNGVNIVGTLYNPALREIIERQNSGIGLFLDTKTDREDRESWFARSDHFPFAVAGVPMVLFNTGEHPDYHTENDTMERLNYDKMTKIVKLVYATAWEVANQVQRIPLVRD